MRNYPIDFKSEVRSIIHNSIQYGINNNREIFREIDSNNKEGFNEQDVIDQLREIKDKPEVVEKLSQNLAEDWYRQMDDQIDGSVEIEQSDNTKQRAVADGGFTLTGNESRERKMYVSISIVNSAISSYWIMSGDMGLAAFTAAGLVLSIVMYLRHEGIEAQKDGLT